MERVALLRTSGRRLLQRCGRPRPLVPAASSSAPRRRLTSSSSAASSCSSSSRGGSSCLLAAAAPLHLHAAGRYWPLTAPGFARRLSVPAVSTSPSPVPSDTDDVHEYAAKLGFEKVSEQVIDECKSAAVLYKHKKTGAEVMSVANDDENKVFGIVFRTPPKNSTGIPHILEHSVLCGSRKYPLKEPFVELLKGSLHTFLNAFTYPDRTCYPVASTNTKDFYNLVDVYLDAVFFPKCVEDFQTFQQEGWHYELNSPEEEISYKGVVFNEMKGVYSQPDNIMGRVSQQALSPDNTYGVDSGGDPNDIPKLTFEEFKEFHSKFYHPSNARIWFYGDDDTKERLQILSEYLDLFEASPARNESKVMPQKLFKEPVRIAEKYPAGQEGDLKKKYMVCTNWLLSEEPLDVETELALGFLDHLLLGTPASPLRRILLESGLGEAIVGGGVEDELLQPQFSIGLKGVSEDNIEKVEELVMQILKNLAELARATKELKDKQETPDPPEALKAVPSLSLQDIPKKPIHVPIEVGEINGVKVLQHDLFTNDVVYSEVVFDMGSMKKEHLQLLPLFCQSLLEMGTKDMDFVQLNQLIGRKTGGISVYPLTSSIKGTDDPLTRIVVRGKAMSTRVEDLFHLMNCLLQDVQFTEQQRFKQFVSQSKARMENRLRGSGHGIAAARMDAKLNAAGWISEQMGGVSYLEYLRDLETRIDQDWDRISASLEEMRKSLFSKEGCLINITSDSKNLEKSGQHIAKFLDALPSAPSLGSDPWLSRLPSVNEAIVIPTQVNYVGKAGNLYQSGYQLNGSAYVISKHISNTWLWDRVRVSGGAYGGFCEFDTHSGVFSYLSYRDPNLLKTLDVYDGTAKFLRELEVDDDALTKAIIGTIGDVDSYQLPDAKGYSSLMRYLLGITEEERQQRREEILATSVKDFKEFADAVEMINDNGVVVAVASPDDVEAANKEKSLFSDIKKCL
ncbi:unnamed protein product [Triticum turgidum subsp. durum]|uniref:Peptidase M16C associated domain-containing protein n=1 Tax=Triticum turgidum subsp. durum TaxID=4567 RepID=A0A9R1B2Z4_TRITD|nr:unnamed protein product [Triticum turgidum subsp. durum]